MRHPETRELRRDLEKALGRRRFAKAIELLETLEREDPEEPRWPRRRGDLLRRKGRNSEAVAAWERSVDLLCDRGFVARAVAMAKTILSVDPSRTDVLERVQPGPARALPRQGRVTAPPPPPDAAPRPEPSIVPLGAKRISRTAGTSLERARDEAKDEVRFEDAPVSIEIDLSELEVSERPVSASAAADVEEPSAERLALLPGFPLFADVECEALQEIAAGAELVERFDDGAPILRRGEPADSLYAIVEGSVRVDVPGASKDRPVLLGEGDVFGESCLLEGARRRADVSVHGLVTVLRIPRAVLVRLVETHPPVGDVLFELLTRRLLGNLLTTSELFVAFDPATRREVARLFEVRRASSGTVLIEAGKRSDGLYVVLAGRIRIEATSADSRVEGGPGAIFGQRSLLTRSPSSVTVRALGELVVLRLAATRFNLLATGYPPVLARLAELAEQDIEPLVPEGLG